MADLPEKLWVNTECSNHCHSECRGSHLLNKQNQTQVTCVSQENNPSLASHKRNKKHMEGQVLKGNANRKRKKCQRCWNKHWTSSCLDVFVEFWFFSSYIKNPYGVHFIYSKWAKKQISIVRINANISWSSYSRKTKQEINNLTEEGR